MAVNKMTCLTNVQYQEIRATQELESKLDLNAMIHAYSDGLVRARSNNEELNFLIQQIKFFNQSYAKQWDKARARCLNTRRDVTSCNAYFNYLYNAGNYETMSSTAEIELKLMFENGDK